MITVSAENAVVKLKLEQALARVGPCPAPARAEQCSVGLKGPVSSTPTTSLPQLNSRQGLNRGELSDSSCCRDLESGPELCLYVSSCVPLKSAE